MDKEDVEKWQKSGILEWAYESMNYRDRVYDLPEDKRINDQYDYDNIDLVNLRLLQAGINSTRRYPESGLRIMLMVRKNRRMSKTQQYVRLFKETNL